MSPIYLLKMATQRAQNAKRQRIYLLEDVAAHAKVTDLWVIHDNKIYDVSRRNLASQSASAREGVEEA